VHVAGAGGEPAHGHHDGGRRLWPGRQVVRDPDRPPAVPGRDAAGDAGPGAHLGNPGSIRGASTGRAVGSGRWQFRPRLSQVLGTCDHRHGRRGHMMSKTIRWVLRYGLAVVTVAVSLFFVVIVGREIAQEIAGMVLLFTVMISAWYGGQGSGLLATALIGLIV